MLLLVVPAVLVIAAGTGVWLHTGSADVVAMISNSEGVAAAPWRTTRGLV